MRALVRRIPDSFVRALSARTPDPPLDVVRARREHAIYVDALVAAGASVTVLDADEACPDCVFVEDMAVVVGGVALITRSGAPPAARRQRPSRLPSRHTSISSG